MPNVQIHNPITSWTSSKRYTHVSNYISKAKLFSKPISVNDITILPIRNLRVVFNFSLDFTLYLKSRLQTIADPSSNDWDAGEHRGRDVQESVDRTHPPEYIIAIVSFISSLPGFQYPFS